VASAGGNDTAYLYDSTGNDTFYGHQTYSYLSGAGFFNYVNAFDKVYAYATAGGTNDIAYLYDSTGNDTLTSTPTYTLLTGAGFYNYASSFNKVYAYATLGNAGGVGDQANLYDSAGTDTFYGRSNYGRLSGVGFYNYFSGFGRVSGYANAGGVDTLDVHAVDYTFSQFGNWEILL
jgi:hypothetical protein